MVLSEQAKRYWKVGTYVSCTIAGIHGVLFAEYNIPGFHEKHVFSDLRLFVHSLVDQHIFGIEPPNSKTRITANRNNSST
ncbi:hypothetical protein ACA910_005067, partial [Epithemia clementina (nom. ined.)]